MTVWIAAARARELLGVTQRQLDRYVDVGAVSVRVDREAGARGRLYDERHVKAIAAAKAQRASRAVRDSARAWALHELKRRYPDEYRALYLYARQRASPRPVGNARTSTSTDPMTGRARTV